MTRSRYRVAAVAALAAVAFGVSPARSEDQFRIGDPLPQVVVDAWQKRREACESVYWKLKVRELITAGLLNTGPEDLAKYGPRPKEDEWREREFTTWIDFSPVRIRNDIHGQTHETNREGVTALAPYRTIHLFDGNELQTYEPNRDNASQLVTELWERDPDGWGRGLVFEAPMMPLFWGHGVVFTPETRDLTEAVATAIDPSDFRVHAVKDPGQDGIVVVRLGLPGRGANFEEFDVDLGKEGAIVRAARYSGGHLYSEANIEWKADESGWQPVAWTRSTFSNDGTLEIFSDCRVVDRICNVDLSDVVFNIDPEAGTPYWDETTRTAFVKSSGEGPDIPLKVHEIRRSAIEQRVKWTISAAILLAVAGAAVVWFRRR